MGKNTMSEGPTPEEPVTLPTALWRLCKATVEKVKVHLASGDLHKRYRVYRKTVVKEFVYKRGGSRVQVGGTHSPREEWDQRAQLELIDKVIKGMPEFQLCAHLIRDRGRPSEDGAEEILFAFVDVVISQALADADDGMFADDISTFLGDVDGAAVDWSVKVPIDGVWLQEDNYDLGDGCLLRRPRNDDFESEQPYETPPVQPGLNPYSAVIEFRLVTKENLEIYEKVELILDVFRLFRVGAVVARSIEVHPKSFTRHSASLGYPVVQPVAHTYELTRQDEAGLRAFAAAMRPILAKYSTRMLGTEAADPQSIAFQRYKDALLSSRTVEAKITAAITCLEALFLKADERSELSHRLSQRVAALLGSLGLTPLEVYNKVSRAYEIRSTFIHGSPISADQQGSAPSLSETILDYARTSLVAFFQLRARLPADASKDALLNRLDNSLLDLKANQKLKELVIQHVTVSR